jgi:hypothetical protein
MIESARRFRKQMLPDKVVLLMLHPKSAVERSAPRSVKFSRKDNALLC